MLRLGLFGTGARIRTPTNWVGASHATVTSHPYIKTKTTFVLLRIHSLSGCYTFVSVFQEGNPAELPEC